MSGRLVPSGKYGFDRPQFDHPLGIIMGFVEDMSAAWTRPIPTIALRKYIDRSRSGAGRSCRDLMDMPAPEVRFLLDLDPPMPLKKTLSVGGEPPLQPEDRRAKLEPVYHVLQPIRRGWSRFW